MEEVILQALGMGRSS